MYKIILAILMIFFVSASKAVTKINFDAYFKKEEGCFILYNVTNDKLVSLYNAKRCAKQISPESTFKIALSLMAFDDGIINQNTIFEWDGGDKKVPVWNQNQTPHTWIKNSAIWVSQQITPLLGKNKIEYYLKQFHYGNRDFSGDPGLNNGLTHAWLSSSLKISANEQVEFLKHLVLNRLPLSQKAMSDTKSNMYLETLNGWKLYGKTGTGFKVMNTGNGKNPLQTGWFIGYVEKNNQRYVFVVNFTDIVSPANSEIGGIRAKNTAKLILSDLGLLS